MSTAPELRQEGSLRLGGTVILWWAFDAPELAAWRYAQPETFGEPDTSHVSLSADFLALAASRAGDSEVQVLAPWSVFQPEFDWPADAAACGCLERNGFADVARELNGDTLVPSPGPVFDRFLVKAEVLEALSAATKADSETSFNTWASVVGVDHSYFAPAFADLTEPTDVIRRSSQTKHTGEAHEAYNRAFDAYFYGGLPVRLGRTSKSVYIDTLESRHGYAYGDAGGETVSRELSTINSMRLVRRFCCTSVEERGMKVFASKLERVAEATSHA
ncbi:hypothetical protein [Herbiconiux sp. A18JL235]|uniref:Uncharacterized protein n=1 Tax=Herbiconiux sp. A18JL235 TaxID=3152363 RepID=A0AB39BKC1_9MICO